MLLTSVKSSKNDCTSPTFSTPLKSLDTFELTNRVNEIETLCRFHILSKVIKPQSYFSINVSLLTGFVSQK